MVVVSSSRYRYPKRLVRALLVLLFGFVLHAAWDNVTAFLSSARLKSITTRKNTNQVDFAWGSSIHRFQNHPQERKSLSAGYPWRGHVYKPTQKTLRILLVVSELDGLHKNGGIGTAYRALASTLASQDGFSVTVLVAHLEERFTHVELGRLREELSKQDVELDFIHPPERGIYPADWFSETSITIYRHLKARQSDFDIVHFHDNNGLGYFSALARYQGLAFDDHLFIVGLHGPDVDWAGIINKKLPGGITDIQLSLFERRSVELADVVVSPSDYMLSYLDSRGWNLPARRYVIPNAPGQANVVKSTRAHTNATKPGGYTSIKELVLFGRLEERKGLRIFLESLASLARNSPRSNLDNLEKVTLLGRDTIDTKSGKSYASLAAATWDSIKSDFPNTVELNILDDMRRDEALAYLGRPDRLAVMPSLADNSPGTVLECVSNSIQFIASRIGGTPELLDAPDRHRLLFLPRPSELATKIGLALNGTLGNLYGRPSTEVVSAETDWIALHQWLFAELQAKDQTEMDAHIDSKRPLVSVIVTHHERPELLEQMLRSLHKQTYTNLEVIVIDDGSKDAESLRALRDLNVRMIVPYGWKLKRIRNVYLGEARNRGAELAKGEYLLFLDDDDSLKYDAIGKLVKVALKTSVNALSTFLDEFEGQADPQQIKELPNRRTWWFAGQDLTLGLLRNSYGSGNIFVKREAFNTVEGFSTYREIGAEDWEFYVKLNLANISHMVVPEELIYVRSDPVRSSMKYTMDEWLSTFRAHAPVFQDSRVSSLGLTNALLLARNLLDKDHLRLSGGVETSAPPLIDSAADFKPVQGWNGWTYTFQPTDAKTVDLSLKAESEAIGDLYRLSTRFDNDFPSISHESHRPFTDGALSLAAVRSFESPSFTEGLLQVDYTASHACGDGAEVVLSLERPFFNNVTELWRQRTLKHPKGHFSDSLELSPGDLLHVAVYPLKTSKCDVVDVRLLVRSMTQSTAESWIPKKASTLPSSTVAVERLTDAVDVGDDEELLVEEIQAESDAEASLETEQTHLALIFDENRWDYAKSVIRSATHHAEPSSLHFHLIVPTALWVQVRHFCEKQGVSVSIYDHQQCHKLTQPVRPFSDDRIHVSAHCKLFLADIIKNPSVDRVMYLDNDITLLSDFTQCAVPQSPHAMLGMAIDMGDACQTDPNACWPMFAEVKSRLSGTVEPAQVNGGVMAMNLEGMRESNFTQRYIDAVAQTYATTRSIAHFGEQDFINSFFRLFPTDLDWLPCGCNYQFRGESAEEKCGGRPVHIAHAWLSGSTYREPSIYQDMFDHFMQDRPGLPPPKLPSSSPVADSQMAANEPVPTFNCPSQSYDCSQAFEQTQYGQRAYVVAQPQHASLQHDIVASITNQDYPNIASLIIPDNPLYNEKKDRQAICDSCGIFAKDPAHCDLPPSRQAKRQNQQFWDCACSLPSSRHANRASVLAGIREPGWVVYLEDDRVFASNSSLAHLMAIPRHESEIIVFTASSQGDQQIAEFKHFDPKTVSRIGYMHHTNLLDSTTWADQRQCSSWRTLRELGRSHPIKRIDMNVQTEHPLARYVARRKKIPQITVVLTSKHSSHAAWLDLALEVYANPSEFPIFADIHVISDSPISRSHLNKVHWHRSRDLERLEDLIKTDGVLLLDTSVSLDKRAIYAMLSQWLKKQSVSVGPFAKLPNTRGESLSYDTFLVANPTFQVLSSDALLVNRKTLNAAIRHARIDSPCFSEKIADFSSQMVRLALPEQSFVDRSEDCHGHLNLKGRHFRQETAAQCHVQYLPSHANTTLTDAQGNAIEAHPDTDVPDYIWLQQRRLDRCLE